MATSDPTNNPAFENARTSYSVAVRNGLFSVGVYDPDDGTGPARVWTKWGFKANDLVHLQQKSSPVLGHNGRYPALNSSDKSVRSLEPDVGAKAILDCLVSNKKWDDLDDPQAKTRKLKDMIERIWEGKIKAHEVDKDMNKIRDLDGNDPLVERFRYNVSSGNHGGGENDKADDEADNEDESEEGRRAGKKGKGRKSGVEADAARSNLKTLPKTKKSENSKDDQLDISPVSATSDGRPKKARAPKKRKAGEAGNEDAQTTPKRKKETHPASDSPSNVETSDAEAASSLVDMAPSSGSAAEMEGGEEAKGVERMSSSGAASRISKGHVDPESDKGTNNFIPTKTSHQSSSTRNADVTVKLEPDGNFDNFTPTKTSRQSSSTRNADVTVKLESDGNFDNFTPVRSSRQPSARRNPDVTVKLEPGGNYDNFTPIQTSRQPSARRNPNLEVEFETGNDSGKITPAEAVRKTEARSTPEVKVETEKIDDSRDSFKPIESTRSKDPVTYPKPAEKVCPEEDDQMKPVAALSSSSPYKASDTEWTKVKEEDAAWERGKKDFDVDFKPIMSSRSTSAKKHGGSS